MKGFPALLRRKGVCSGEGDVLGGDVYTVASLEGDAACWSHCDPDMSHVSRSLCARENIAIHSMFPPPSIPFSLSLSFFFAL